MIVWVHFIKVSLFSVRMPYLMTKIFNRKIGFDNIFLKVGWNTYLMSHLWIELYCFLRQEEPHELSKI